MSYKDGKGKAKENGKKKKSEKNPAAVFPGAFPLFPIGSFLLPLIIPVPLSPETPQGKNPKR